MSVTVPEARISAGKALCEHSCGDDAPPCAACQARADVAVRNFLFTLGLGNPRYAACRRPDGSTAHVWIDTQGFHTLAGAIGP